jgi:lauroyl/myristoyl acyltransferase
VGQHLVDIDQLEIPAHSDRRQTDRAVSEALMRRIETAVREDPGSWLWTLDRWRASSTHLATGDCPNPLAGVPQRAGTRGA